MSFGPRRLKIEINCGIGNRNYYLNFWDLESISESGLKLSVSRFVIGVCEFKGRESGSGLEIDHTIDAFRDRTLL